MCGIVICKLDSHRFRIIFFIFFLLLVDLSKNIFYLFYLASLHNFQIFVLHVLTCFLQFFFDCRTTGGTYLIGIYLIGFNFMSRTFDRVVLNVLVQGGVYCPRDHSGLVYLLVMSFFYTLQYSRYLFDSNLTYK